MNLYKFLCLKSLTNKLNFFHDVLTFVDAPEFCLGNIFYIHLPFSISKLNLENAKFVS